MTHWVSFVLGNPINYIDPSGHMQEEPDDGGLDPDDIKNHLEEVYDWNAEGDFNTEQLFSIWDAAIELRLYVSKQVGHDGLEWMKTYLSGTTFTINSFITKVLGASFAPDHKTVHLIGGFEAVRWEQGVVGHILHEVGHILDNRLANNIDRYKAGIPPLSAVFVGGGPADALYAFMGGQHTNMLRYQGGVSFAGDPSRAFNNLYPYGNNSSAVYFAHTLAISVVDYANVPSQAGLWMSSFISLLP